MFSRRDIEAAVASPDFRVSTTIGINKNGQIKAVKFGSALGDSELIGRVMSSSLGDIGKTEKISRAPHQIDDCYHRLLGIYLNYLRYGENHHKFRQEGDSLPDETIEYLEAIIHLIESHKSNK